ncbi:hypothetical protein GCM10010399_76630 [Dactylosporangium fulvum]
MSMLGPRRARGDDTLYARAMPEKVELCETYAVEQEISRNPTTEQIGDGSGRIEITVPYDGSRFFTRQAVADVERVLGRRGGAGEHRATVGHLLLADHTNTNGLRGVMRHHSQAGVIPVSVPVAKHDGSLDLSGDRQACVIGYDYHPDHAPVYPLQLEVWLDDPDSLTDAFAGVRTLMTRGRENPSWLIERLRQEASFTSKLLFTFKVKVSLPVKGGFQRKIEPVVKHMSVEWPTLTSMQSTELYVGQLPSDPEPRVRKAAVRYNPVQSRLEWTDVPTFEVLEDGAPKRGEAGTRIFHSVVCVLAVGHPGELFEQERLEVSARVEIPNYLLSGLEARSYDATGRPQVRQPEHVTKLNLRTMVYPADIFAGRTFSPYQQFVFDDIIPDEMRITDIVTVLRNSKFTVENPRPQTPQDPLAPMWLVLAHRSQGPDDLDLLVAVEGKRAILDREHITSSSVKLKGSAESGQLKVSVLGTLPRDHRELTREMNAFQQKLRERFRFHQMSREVGAS